MAPKAEQNPVIILAHSENPPLTKLLPTLERIGHKAQVYRTPFGEEPALPFEKIHGVIIMGGPVSIYQWPDLGWLRREMVWVEKALKANLPIFGICLGCQMLAHLTGGSVQKGDKGFSFGFSGKTLLVEDDPVFGDEIKNCRVFQAHGDTYVLPAAARQYVTGNHYTQQAAHFGNKVYGVQFHPEVCVETITRWHKSRIERGRMTADDLPLPQLLAEAEQQLPCVHHWLEKFLARLFA